MEEETQKLTGDYLAEIIIRGARECALVLDAMEQGAFMAGRIHAEEHICMKRTDLPDNLEYQGKTNVLSINKDDEDPLGF